MLKKDIGQSYPTIVNGVMTGTAVITSAKTNVNYKDTVSISLSWTGTPTGTIVVQGSVDYNPGTPQSAGSPNSGTWINIPVIDQSGNVPAAQGAAGNALIVFDSQFPWVQVVYTNASSTGTLNGWIMTKSLGS